MNFSTLECLWEDVHFRNHRHHKEHKFRIRKSISCALFLLLMMMMVYCDRGHSGDNSQTDYSVVVDILSGDMSIDYAIDPAFGIPSCCMDEFEDFLVQACVNSGMSDDECVGGAWRDYEDTVDDGTGLTYGAEIREKLNTGETGCGTFEMLLGLNLTKKLNGNEAPLPNFQFCLDASDGVILFAVDASSQREYILPNPYCAYSDDAGGFEFTAQVFLPTRAMSVVEWVRAESGNASDECFIIVSSGMSE